MNIFSCAFNPSLCLLYQLSYQGSPCLLWRNVCLHLLSMFLIDLGSFFKFIHLFLHRATWTVCINIFCRLIPCWSLPLQILFCELSFHYVYGFLYCSEPLSLIRSHLFVFVFIYITLGYEWVLRISYIIQPFIKQSF